MIFSISISLCPQLRFQDSLFRKELRNVFLPYHQISLNASDCVTPSSVKDSYPKDKRQKEGGGQTKTIWGEKCFNKSI